MSLINEALKKTQRLRSKGADEAPPVPGSQRITKRGQPRSARFLLLLAVGGLTLVVLSVVVTVQLLNRPETPPQVAATPMPAPPPPPEAMAPPRIIPPVAPPAPTPMSAPDVPAAAPAPAEPLPPVALAPAVPVPASPPPATEAATTKPVTGPAAPNDRIVAYLEALRITGVRPSGQDSRVLMNERVYRLNAIVERTLSLRLTKVESDHLVFTDANGTNYIKYF